MASPRKASATARLHRAGVGAALLLLVGVSALAASGDLRVNSGSDAGGKTATVVAIADRGFEGVDLGYWAEGHDPEGVHHPLVHTERRDDRWIQVTSAVMPAASAVGERAFGSLGALWLAMVSVPVGAFGAARLARSMGAPSGALAFLIVGAASPLAFYATDQWEHAPSVAAGLWATAWLGEPLRLRGFVALGAAAGLAGGLRRETMLVLFVLGLAQLVDPIRRRFWLTHRFGVLAAGTTAAAVLAMIYSFDYVVLGRSLTGRTLAQAGLAASNFDQRLNDALLTTVSQYTNPSVAALLLGLLSLVGIALATWGWRTDERRRVVFGYVCVVVSLLVRLLVGGLSFVPGAFAVLPVAAAAPVLARGAGRRLWVAALVAIAVVLLVQWTGSLNAQWGGRYLLLPALLVTVVAVAEIERRGVRHPAAVLALGATVAIAGIGFVFQVERARGFGDARDAVLDVVGDDVVVSSHPHFPREIAESVIERRWLRADSTQAVKGAFLVAAQAAPQERIWLLHDGRCAVGPCDRTWAAREQTVEIPGYRSTGVTTVPWPIGNSYVLERFEPL